MSDGQGNITYGTTGGGTGGGSGTFDGADDGLSQNAGNLVQLGQAIGAALDPAKLLDDREIPMEGFYLRMNGGPVGLGDTAVPVGVLYIQRAIAAGNPPDDLTDNLILLNPTASAAGSFAQSPALVFSLNTWNGSASVNQRFRSLGVGLLGGSALIDFFSNDGGVTYTEIARMVDDGTFVAGALVAQVDVTAQNLRTGTNSIGEQGSFGTGEIGMAAGANPGQINIFNTITGIGPDSTYAAIGWKAVANYLVFQMLNTGVDPVGLGFLFQAPVGFGTAAAAVVASAAVEIDSTTTGFLPPRMTTTQKLAIGSPAAGLMVFDTTLKKLAIYSGTAWETVTSI
jgi:hypothetical protein